MSSSPLQHRLPLSGGCQCGAVRYEITAPPLALYVCHCTQCRRQSASAFGISLYVPTAGVRLVEGKPRRWTRPAAIGGTTECFFCGECGSRVWHRSVGDGTITSIKGGSLDHAVDLADAVHVWTQSRLPGVVIPDHAEQHLQEPPDG